MSETLFNKGTNELFTKIFLSYCNHKKIVNTVYSFQNESRLS